MAAEIHGSAERDLSRSSDLVLNAGGRAHITEHLSLLFSAGRGLQSDSPDFISYTGFQITY